mmetsp:Transcript_21802/g.64278  ORF Transcript_21802/g.64278 Transcript_21802/m.64278 type:complete len:578 (-) Transcript_21802:1979-3712(-)
MASAIRENYTNNWILDGLPATTEVENDAIGGSTSYTRQGFPIGFTSPSPHDYAYVHNHINFEIQYQLIRNAPEEYNVVGFSVQPFSVRHKLEKSDPDASTEDVQPAATIVDPIVSCQTNWRTKRHTSAGMIHEDKHQFASGDVLYTYDVIWVENKEKSYSSRWDDYLSTGDEQPTWTHLSSITKISLFLVALSLWHSFKKAEEAPLPVSNSNTDERGCEQIRREHSFLEYTCLASITGTGAQILLTGVVTLCVCTYSRRGSILNTIISSFVLSGFLGGFVAAKQYEMFAGSERTTLLPLLVSALFPGALFGVIFSYYSMAPTGSTLNLQKKCLWHLTLLLATNAVTVFLGSKIGRSRLIYHGPTVNPLLQFEMPERFLIHRCGKAAIIVISGVACNLVMCNWAMSSELEMVVGKMWAGQYYGCAGIRALFLLIIMLLTTVMCSLIAAISTSYLIRWKVMQHTHTLWWCSFLTGGLGIGFFLMVWSINFMEAELGPSVTPQVKALNYALAMVVSMTFFLGMGSAGVFCAQWMHGSQHSQQAIPDPDSAETATITAGEHTSTGWNSLLHVPDATYPPAV